MPFFAKKGFNPSIEATDLAIPADRFDLDMPDAKARAEKLVELWAVIEQCWKEVTTTQWKYAERHTQPSEFKVGDTFLLSDKNI